MTRFFDQKNIILAQVQEKDLNSFLVSFDIDDNGNLLYQLDKFTEAIINVIPEYVFASYEDPNIPQHQVIEKLREAAKSIYKIKDFELMYRYYVEKDITDSGLSTSSSNIFPLIILRFFFPSLEMSFFFVAACTVLTFPIAGVV